MQLRIGTDYTIRIIIYLIVENTIIPAAKIAKETGMTINYVLKIMKQLEEEHIVKSYRGANGGYCVVEDAKSITLWQIISLMEPTTKLNRCLEKDRYCSGNRTQTCSMHQFYKRLQEDVEILLKGITMEMIINGEIDEIVNNK